MGNQKWWPYKEAIAKIISKQTQNTRRQRIEVDTDEL
jgi:hypothetical protein